MKVDLQPLFGIMQSGEIAGVVQPSHISRMISLGASAAFQPVRQLAKA